MLSKYQQRLENNPTVQFRTTRQYIKAIREMLDLHGENPSIEQLNSFIAIKCNRRQPYVKYAIKEYLIWVGREQDYNLLVQARTRKPVRQKVFLTRAALHDIADGVTKEPYRTIGKLQMDTAARASAIISIERKKIRREEKWIRITLNEKGDKPTTVYLLPQRWSLIEPWLKEQKKYLFLDKEAIGYSKDQLNKKVENLYKRYLENLQESAERLNMHIGTHDIRRSVANIVLLETNNPRIVQKMLDHGSLAVTERYLDDPSKLVGDAMLQHQKGL